MPSVHQCGHGSFYILQLIPGSIHPFIEVKLPNYEVSIQSAVANLQVFLHAPSHQV